MICEHPDCTGNHNDRRWGNLCPRTLARRRERQRIAYWQDVETHRERSRQYRRTAAGMLAQLRYDAKRRVPL